MIMTIPKSGLRIAGLLMCCISMILPASSYAVTLSVAEDTSITPGHSRAGEGSKTELRITSASIHAYEHDNKHKEDDDDEDDAHHKHGKERLTYVRFDAAALDVSISGDDVLKATLRLFINRVHKPGAVQEIGRAHV